MHNITQRIRNGKMHKKGLRIGFVLAMALCAVPLRAQDGEISASDDFEVNANARVLLAMSSRDYLVTPGDVYTLSFAQGTRPVVYTILLDTTYKIRVANLAVLNVRGKSFIEVKQQVEEIVSKNFSMSGVQFTLTTPGLFYVRIKGEVTAAAEVQAWGLTRLSSVVGRHRTDYSSIRNIQVTDAAGKTRTYDLFKAQRDADLSQDPHVRPGDVVTINRYSRKVTLSGAVERGGTYEMLSGENLKELISLYGNGYTDFADQEFIQVTRLNVDAKEEADKFETIYLNSRREIGSFVLFDHDAVSVRSINEQRPVVFVEGAIYGADTSETGGLIQPANSNVSSIRFSPGANYTYFIRSNSKMFADVADLEKVYIARGNKIIPINAYKIIYDYTYSVDEQLQSNDRLVVPFRQYFVSVAGAVVNPGRYPYLPDRDWSYYIGLAGGFIPNRNKHEKIDIVDMYGKKHRKKDPITPETTITAASNSFTYYFSNYSSVISILLTAISTTITVMVAANVL